MMPASLTPARPPTQHELDREVNGRKSALVMMWAYAVLLAEGHLIADMAPAVWDARRGKWIVAVEVRTPADRRLIARRLYLWRVGDHTLELINPVESMAHEYEPRRYDLKSSDRDGESRPR